MALRDTRDIIIHPCFGRSALRADPYTIAALAIATPCLAAITVTQSGLIIIGPADILKSCRDPVAT